MLSTGQVNQVLQQNYRKHKDLIYYRNTGTWMQGEEEKIVFLQNKLSNRILHYF